MRSPFALLALVACARSPEAVQARTITVASSSASAVPVEASPASGPRTRVIVAGRTKRAIWSVTAAGEVSRVAFPEEAMQGGLSRLGAGGDGPMPSPDGKRIAWLRGGARDAMVMVRDLASETSIEVFPSPLRHELLLTDWSPDGKSILLTITPIDGPNGADANPDGSELTFYALHLAGDLRARRYERVDVPSGCEYQGWFGSGELLVVCERGTVLAQARGAAVVPLIAKNKRFSQAHVGESGAVAVVANERVVVLEAATFAARDVSERAGHGDYQFPKTSPSGKHVAYEHHVRTGGGHVRVDLVVDRETVAEVVDDYEWIDDRAIVVLRGDAPPTVLRLPGG